MKAYLHIHNTWDFCHKDVRVEIEIDNRPVIGDTFWMGQDELDEFEKQITAYVENASSDCQRDAYGERNHWHSYGIHLEDCIFVTGICWIKHEDGKYHMHIELNDRPEDD